MATSRVGSSLDSSYGLVTYAMAPAPVAFLTRSDWENAVSITTGADILITDDARRFDAIHTRHLDVHAYHAWTELAGQFDCFLTVSGFAHNLVATIFQHGNQIHTVHGFVFGNDDGALVRLVIIGRIRLGSRSSLELLISEYFVRFRGLLCSHVGLFPLSHPKPA